jgi:hypothetical protein
MKFKVTAKDMALAAAFAILGYLLSDKGWIMWMNSLNPIEGMAVYYVILYVSLFILSMLTLVIFGFQIKSPSQTFGLLLVTFAFFIIVGWTSGYIQYVTTGSQSGASVIFYQCEDGAVWYFWNTVIGIKDIEIARILTFSITTFTLALVGSGLINGDIKLTGV